MASMNEVYEKIDGLEEKLRSDLDKAYFLEQNFQAYADYSREYLKAIGKELDYMLIEEAVRDSDTMKKIHLQLDKVTHSYNDLVREIATIRRDGIAKSIVSAEGSDDVHSINSVLIRYGIDIKEDMFSKAVHIISQTSRSVISRKFGRDVLLRTEILTPNNMTFPEFIFLLNGYAISTSYNKRGNEVHANAAG